MVVFLGVIWDPDKWLEMHTRWAPTIYKWSYNPYKWPYKWVTGVITLLIGVINLVINGRGPTLYVPNPRPFILGYFGYTRVSMEVIVTFVSKLVYFAYLRDVSNLLI